MTSQSMHDRRHDELQNMLGIADAADQYVGFRLGGEGFALPILKIRELARVDNITPVPRTPDFVLGVMNLRGNVIPMVDLARRFDLASDQSVEGVRVGVVVEIERGGRSRTLGILVDELTDIHVLRDEQLLPPPDLSESIPTAFILAIADLTDGALLLLDADKLFDIDELLAVDQALARHEPEKER